MHRQVDDNRDGATRCTQSCACACIHVLLCDAFPRTCPLMTSVNEAAILFSALEIPHCPFWLFCWAGDECNSVWNDSPVSCGKIKEWKKPHFSDDFSQRSNKSHDISQRTYVVEQLWVGTMQTTRTLVILMSSTTRKSAFSHLRCAVCWPSGVSKWIGCDHSADSVWDGCMRGLCACGSEKHQTYLLLKSGFW